MRIEKVSDFVNILRRNKKSYIKHIGLSFIATKVVQVVWRVLVTNRERYQTLHNVNKMFCDKL